MCVDELTKGNESEGKLPHYQEVVALLISQGMTQAAAARMMGIHPGMVTKWKKNKLFADFLAMAKEEVVDAVELARNLLIEGAPLAALKIRELVNGEEETVQLRAAGDVLDRAGVSKTQRVKAEVSGEITLMDLITKAREDAEDE